MQITKLSFNKKNPKKIDIFVDDEEYATINADVVANLRLREGLELTVELIDNIKSLDDIQECYLKGLSYLTKSSKTEKEIINYLYQKGFHKKLIDESVERYKNYRLIDDERYCQNYIDYHKNKKSKFIIKQNLLNKGINKDLIDTYLEDIEQNEVIIKYTEKYLKGKNLDNVIYQKLIKYLLGKGFTISQIKNSIKDFDYESWD